MKTNQRRLERKHILQKQSTLNLKAQTLKKIIKLYPVFALFENVSRYALSPQYIFIKMDFRYPN